MVARALSKETFVAPASQLAPGVHCKAHTVKDKLPQRTCVHIRGKPLGTTRSLEMATYDLTTHTQRCCMAIIAKTCQISDFVITTA